MYMYPPTATGGFCFSVTVLKECCNGEGKKDEWQKIRTLTIE